MSAMDELVKVFRGEVGELLDTLGETLQVLRAAEGAERQEPLDTCMRIAHNIKGISASVGFDQVEKVAHALESALGRTAGEPEALEPLVAPVMEAITVMQRLAEGQDLGERPAGLVRKLLGEEQQPRSNTCRELSKKREGSEATGGPAAGTLRVEASRLDRLMGFASELLVIHTRMVARKESLEELQKALEATMRELAPDARERLVPLRKKLEQQVSADRHELLHFGHLSQELSAAMKQVRMTPLHAQTPVWRRVVRECGEELGKQVELRVQVGDIELDKVVLDRIRDPLIHLLRNAVDHGIESPDARERAGKPRVGQVSVRADIQGATATIEIADDGRGLEPGKIARAAVARGVVDEARLSRMVAADIVELIFEPGFSTAEEVTRISGRGVGLDVVREHVTDLGGRVSVERGPLGSGTCFKLLVPVSVVSRKGLLVQAGQAVYALPIEHVVQTQRIARHELERAEGSWIHRGGSGEPLRIRSLAALMGGKAEKDEEPKLKIVVLAWGDARVGMVVSQVLREEEYVVKKLPPNLSGVPGVHGAVILADGSVAVAVDVSWLFGAALERTPAAEEARPATRATKRVLVVDDALTTRTLHRNVLQAAGYEVVCACDGEEAWRCLTEKGADVVVSDVQMPVLDGLGLTRRIRGSPAHRHIPVVLVTGCARPEDRAAGMAAGATEYLVKATLDSDRLVEAVSRFT